MTTQINSSIPTAPKPFPMVQQGLGLIVLSILVASVYTAVKNSERKAEIKTTVSQVSGIGASLRKLSDYSNLTVDSALKNGIFPSEFVTPGRPINLYGGNVNVAAVTLIKPNDAAVLTFEKVPENQCMDIANGTASIAREIRVNDLVVKPDNGPINLLELVHQCESAQDVAIQWTFSPAQLSPAVKP